MSRMSKLQLDAALGALRNVLDAKTLAQKINRRVETVSRIRTGKSEGTARTLKRIQEELEGFGVEFSSTATHDIVSIDRRQLEKFEIQSQVTKKLPFVFECVDWSGHVLSMQDWNDLLSTIQRRTLDPLSFILRARADEKSLRGPTPKFGVRHYHTSDMTLRDYLNSSDVSR